MTLRTCRILSSALLILLFSGCKDTKMQTSRVPAHSSAAVPLKPLISLPVPADTLDPVYDRLNERSSVIRFYQSTGYATLWTEHLDGTPKADTLMAFVANVRYYGLFPGNYHDAELTRLGALPKEVLRKEILLTDAFLTLARDLKSGRRRLSSPALPDSVSFLALEKVRDGHPLKTTLEQFEPGFQGYADLKRSLRMALDIAEAEDRQSLIRGSTSDSIPAQSAIRLIEVNLERWRREGTAWPSRYIVINIPSFMLQVVDNEQVVLESRVIVGTPEKQTPLLSSEIQCISIYPYWNVPRKIAIEEYLPLIRKDTSFLRLSQFDVLDSRGKILNPGSVTWEKFSERYFPVRLRQREGTENALGVIKFIFDNPYAVFLHDTNAKRLFRSNVRAFSHGCIRMEKAEELAHYLTTGSMGKKSSVIEKYLEQQQQHTVNLSRPIPIYVRYFTCEARAGMPSAFKDLYALDTAIINLIYRKPTEGNDDVKAGQDAFPVQN
jgi:L,D-transpeptidase YcbB